ncbi:MAG: glycosyltransferase [Actinobacteria bacterium]|nr:glycosyltransferase [Actinomycetota bacterium]
MHKINAVFITDRMILGHGVDLVIDKVATGLSESGYNCEIYCNNFDDTFKEQRPYKLKKLPIITNVNTFDLESRTKKLELILNNQGADIFIINSFPFYSLAGHLNKPVISINYGVISTEGMTLKRKLFYRYMDFTQNFFYFRKSSRIISISDYLNIKLPAYLRKKADYVHLGADHYRSDKEITNQQIIDFRHKLGVEDNDCLLLYVGRLNPVNQPYKGTQELINLFHEAKKQNSKIKLLMVGFGSHNDEIAIKNEGILAITNAPQELMPLIYSSCDIYTTCTKWEGFDLPIVEAQSFGKPSVCYNLCAHPEITESGKTGFLVSSKEEFLSRIIELSINDELKNRMNSYCFEFSKRFSWKKTVSEYDRIIRSILEKELPEERIKAIKYDNKNISSSKPENNKTTLTGESEIIRQDTTKDETDKISEKKATVLIINYNSSISCLEECINSLKSQTNKDFDILIFDNGSTNDVMNTFSGKIGLDESLKGYLISEEDKKNIKIEIIKNCKNAGLGKAINLALDKIDTRYILISNFDVVYDRNAIEEFMKMLDTADENIIGLAPKIKLSYRRDYIESVGTYLDASLYDCYQGFGQLDLHQYDVPEEIFGVSFTSAFLRTDAFQESYIGKIEESFYLFYEDFDFCYRADLLGYKFRSCPNAVVYHKYSYSFREESTAFETKYYYKRLNLLKMMYKNSENNTINKILPIETRIMKNNLKDKNLKKVSKRILSGFRKSRKYLLKQRGIIQLTRVSNDYEIIKYCWGEQNFFDIVKNEPKYEIASLEKTYRRLFVITGSNKYMEYISYLHNIDFTKFRFEKEILRQKLHSKLENEPISVHEFIDKL